MKSVLRCLILAVPLLSPGEGAEQPNPLYFAEAFGPGRISRLEKGVTSSHYTRGGGGGISSLATAPDGTVYFSDASRFDLYKIEQGVEVLVYAHSTYLRDVAVDSRGKVYFSEATGAGGDGVIYRLDGAQAVVFYRVRLSQVDGSWAGTFAFDPSNDLWLSSGNRVPASLYKVVQEVPQRVYTSTDGSISGFFFEGRNSLLYADWQRRIYRLMIPEYQRSLVYSSPSAQGLSAVAPAVVASGSLAKTPSAPAVIKNGYGPVFFLRFSPNGRELARACEFGPVVLFDTASYNKGRTFSIGMRMVAYSPDGSRMATAEGTDGARVWDTAVRGKPIPKPVLDELYELETPLQVLQAPSRDPKQRVFWTEFSPDAKRLITAYANGHVKVWSTSSWAVEDELIVTDAEVRAAAFAPDSKTVVIGDTSGVLHHWNFETKAEIKTTRTPLGAITGVVFAPDGKTLVTTHQTATGGGVMIWNTGTWIAQTKGEFRPAAFSPDSKLLALGGAHIELIDPASGKQIRAIELPEMTLRESQPQFQFKDEQNPDAKIPISVLALAFSPDGRTLAAGCRDGTVRLMKMTP